MGPFLGLSDVRGIIGGVDGVWFIPPCFYRDKCIILWLGLFPLYLNVFLSFVFVVRMSSVCLADAQEFWILRWIFAIMITACLELLSQTEIYYSWMLYLFIQSSMADYFDIPLRHTCFPLHADNSGRLHKLEPINNK